MDWNKIWLLLDIVHKSVNVPNTEVIRKRAMEELALWNSGAFAEEEWVEGIEKPEVEAPEEDPSDDEPELKAEGRRL